ncbi:hypothetical protein BsWGS_25651 [Bradybaena similaris]
MESHSQFSSNNVKLEPFSKVRPSNSIKLELVSETDCVHSSGKKILTEHQAFEEIDSKISASVKIEQPEVYIDHPGQEIHPSSESYPFITAQEKSQLEMCGNIEHVKQELSSILYKDISQEFNKMVYMTHEIIQDIVEYSNTESRLTENEAYKKHDNCCQMSRSMISAIDISEKLYLATDNCQSHNVHTPGKHIQTSVKPLDPGPPISVTRHKRTHTGEKAFKCDECCSSFTKPSSLKCHKRTHSREKPYKCDECCASFTQASSLKRHKKTHTGEKPYKCDECGASFTQASTLKHHKRTHTGEKPYKCDECGASFTHVSSLKCHKRTHTGEKPYKCDECCSSFTESSSLKCHKRKHSGEKPYK